MARKVGPVVVAVIVAASLMKAEDESPGATGRGAQQLRNAVSPAVSEAVGAAGDGVLILRDELERQGIDPTNVLQDPATVDEGAERDANGIAGG